MIGDDASLLRTLLEVSYPMENGIVRSWDDMTHLFNYTFGPSKLNIDPSHSRLLLTEPPLNPLKNREKMVEVCLISHCRVLVYHYFNVYRIVIFYLDKFYNFHYQVYLLVPTAVSY